MRKSAGDTSSLGPAVPATRRKHRENNLAFVDRATGLPLDGQKKAPFPEGNGAVSNMIPVGLPARLTLTKNAIPEGRRCYRQVSLTFSRCSDQKESTTPIANTTRQSRRSSTTRPSTKANALRNGLRV